MSAVNIALRPRVRDTAAMVRGKKDVELTSRQMLGLGVTLLAVGGIFFSVAWILGDFGSAVYGLGFGAIGVGLLVGYIRSRIRSRKSTAQSDTAAPTPPDRSRHTAN